MALFEIVVSVAEANPASWLLEADNWVDAWRDSLARFGIRELPEDAVFESQTGETKVMLEQKQLFFTITQREEELVASELDEDVTPPAEPSEHVATMAMGGVCSVDRESSSEDSQLEVLFRELELERARFAARLGRECAPSSPVNQRPKNTPKPLLRSAETPWVNEKLPQQFRALSAMSPQTEAQLHAWVLDSFHEALSIERVALLEEREGALYILDTHEETLSSCRGYRVQSDELTEAVLRANATRLKVHTPRVLTFEGPYRYVREVLSLMQVPVPHSRLRLIAFDSERANGFLERDLKLASYFAQMLGEQLASRKGP